MELPDTILLNKITKQHIYCDKKSKEQSTNKIKPKYKLAGNFLLDECFFHVLTTRKGACKELCTLPLCLFGWEDVVFVFKSKLKDVCYCDLTKFEIMKCVILLKKMKDRKNGFPYVAKLSDQKYKELIKLKKYLYKLPQTTKETREIIKKGIAPSYDPLLSKLGL